MSTRCVIKFSHGRAVVAQVYRHHDGYPDGEHGVLRALQRFYETVELHTRDTRFDDGMYLAAKFLVWGTQLDGQVDGPVSLDFLGYGITDGKHGDLAYVYTVNCDNLDAKGRPIVSYKRARYVRAS